MSEEQKNEILEKEKELDEGELETVSGGLGCGCVIGGGGAPDEDTTTCGCFIYGVSETSGAKSLVLELTICPGRDRYFWRAVMWRQESGQLLCDQTFCTTSGAKSEVLKLT